MKVRRGREPGSRASRKPEGPLLLNALGGRENLERQGLTGRKSDLYCLVSLETTETETKDESRTNRLILNRNLNFLPR
jgi:hypothetical protein